ncbi:MAG: sigma-70 family RNA polymerase sigma factor [Acidimicrobiales bacterium]
MDVVGEAATQLGDDGSLFASLYDDLRRFAAVVGWPDHDPDDLIQEAVARALRHGPLVRLENPGAYLRTAIVRLASNGWRGRLTRDDAHRRLAASDTGEVVDAYPSDLDELRRLDARDRALLYLSVVERRPYAEIAALLGMAEPAARKRSSRALARLRRELTIQEAE